MVSALVGLLVLLGALNAVMYLQQPAMVFYPLRELDALPSDWGLAYEDIALTTADGVRLHGWYLPTPNATRVLLFLHGNGGNISHRGDSIAIFRRLGFDVFIFDYRGYGQSEGRPSEPGLYADAASAWRYLSEARGWPADRIVLFGRSLGGTVAAQLAVGARPAALILESTLSSSRDFAAEVFPLLSRLTLLRYDFNTADFVRQVDCPVLVLHSPDDEIMPFKLGEKVYASAKPPKQFVRLQGDHNSGFLLSQPGYEQALQAFVAAHVAGGT